MSGFWRSRATSPGTGSVPPTPGSRLGLGASSAVCAMDADAAVSAPPAMAAVDRISRRESLLVSRSVRRAMSHSRLSCGFIARRPRDKLAGAIPSDE